MGYSISWIGFQAKDKRDVLPLLGLVDTGEADEANESSVSAAALPTGWYVVFFNDYTFITPERLAKFSAGLHRYGLPGRGARHGKCRLAL
jgi:hypothetical protein